MSSRFPRVAILGAGRAGASLHRLLREANYEVVALWTRSDASAERARSEGFPVVSGALPASLGRAELVFLAVADDAVGAVARELAAKGLPQSAVVAHLAGSLDLTPLDPLRKAGLAVGSLHPLVSIASRTTPLAGAWCAVEGSDVRAAAMLERVASSLGLHVLHPKGDRARYHAAACLVGNFPQALMELAIEQLGKAGIAPTDARAALAPLLESATRNAMTRTGPDALTGPIARGDVAVVRKHLDALADTPRAEAAYRALGVVAAETMSARLPEASAEIAQLLEDTAKS